MSLSLWRRLTVDAVARVTRTGRAEPTTRFPLQTHDLPSAQACRFQVSLLEALM